VTAELLSPSDGEPSAVQRIRALYQQRELDGGERLTTSVVAGEVAVSQTLAGAALRLLRTIEAADQQREAPQIDAYQRVAESRSADATERSVGALT
jgi:hypothetical protein